MLTQLEYGLIIYIIIVNVVLTLMYALRNIVTIRTRTAIEVFLLLIFATCMPLLYVYDSIETIFKKIKKEKQNG